MRTKRALLCLLVLPALTLAACSSGKTKGGQTADEVGITPTSIHLGAVAPLSGTSASFGDVTAGIKAYYDSVNDAGGINGRTIDFTILDDAYDPSKTVPQTEKLISQEKVFAITGNVGTKTSQAVYQRLNDEKVPSIMASGDPTMVNPVLPYIFEGLAPLNADINEQITYVKANFPGKKVGFLAENNSSATNEMSLLTPAFNDSLVEQTFLLTDSDLSTQIVALKQAGVDVIIFNGVPKYLALAVAEARGQNWQVPFVSNNAAVDASFLSTAGAQAEGVVTVTGYRSDPTDPEIVKADTIIKKYAPDVTPGPLSREGYAIGQIAVEALKASGQNPTRDSFLAALNQINISAGTFIGQATLSTTKHNPYGCEQALQVKNGALAPIGEVTCGS